MRLLLDTHILIWWLTGDRKLPKAIAGVIASKENDVAVSAAAIWEIAIKRALGTIDIDIDELLAAIASDGFTELPIRFVHSSQLESLPRHHDDPFDRMQIAQAIVDGRRLITRDSTVLRYAGIAGFDPLPA
jgi:PIN domain nuclease of toxin-antitoxin system